MLKKSLQFIAITIALCAPGLGQILPAPRDSDESEAWQIWRQYKESVAAEDQANRELRQARIDVSDSSLSSIGVFGSDPQDRAALFAARRRLDAERRRQSDLLAKWERFFWRYGDLKWSVAPEIIDDKRSGRTMDRIEFALTYVPFKPGSQIQPVLQPPAVTGASFVAEKGDGNSWSHIKVTLTNVTMFKSVDQRGWRNNGTGFTAMTNGSSKAGIRIEVSARGGVSYEDYSLTLAVRTSQGRVLANETTRISKDGAAKTFEFTWDPVAAQGDLNISVSITGGNPESFTYFVSGGVTRLSN